MNQNMRNCLYLELHVPSFVPVLEFYRILGFREVIRGYDPEYLLLEREGTLLAFWSGTDRVYEHSYFSRLGRQSTRGYGVEIVVPVDDVEAFFVQVKDQVPIVGSLKERPWGCKDFRISDPYGYYIRFTEPYDMKASVHIEPAAS